MSDGINGAASSPAQPAGGLPELLRELSGREPSEEDLDRVKSALLNTGMDLGSGQIEALVQSWTKALRRSLSMDVPTEKVLCGFSSVLDTVYQLDPYGAEVRIFIEWAASKISTASDRSTDNFINSAISLARGLERHGARIKDLTEGDGIATNLTEVVAVLLWCMENQGRKPLLTTPELQEQMEEYLKYRSKREPAAVLNPSLGGAAGNMCYILHELGLNVSAHWLYHPEHLSQATPYRLTRAITTGGFVQEMPARQKDTYFAFDQLYDHPLRRNTSFEFPISMPIRTQSGTVLMESKAADRTVYRTLMHRSAYRGWDNFVLRVPTLGGGTIDLVPDPAQQQTLLGVDGWPFVPLFCSWRIEGRQMIIEIADDAVMEQVADRFDYFILTALMGIRDPITKLSLILGDVQKGPDLYSVVRDHLIKQLRVLSEKGVVIHTEISAASASVFTEMSEVVLHGRIGSVGMNDDDLSRITGSDAFKGTRFFYSELEAEERDKNKRHLTTFRRYQRAVHLAKQLDVDELYVHGNDVDIVVRRRTSRGAIWRAIEALLLTKAAVVLALLKRAGTAMPGLSPIPTANGFHGLVRFAAEFVKDRYPRNENKRKDLFREILDRKYFFERDPEAYSVIVAPVFWPDPSPRIVTVGAGDMTSSVVAIFSGK